MKHVQEDSTKYFYFHVRPFVTLQPLKFHHRGGYTIAAKIIDDSYIQWSVARCSMEDNFSRKRGRLIAEGRLRKGRPEDIFVFNSSSLKAFHQYLIDTLINDA